MLFVCYPKCSTCMKAKKWLEEKEIEFEQRDIKEEKPTAEELKTWWRKSGLPLKRFFNTSGKLYKEMQLKDRIPNMSEDEHCIIIFVKKILPDKLFYSAVGKIRIYRTGTISQYCSKVMYFSWLC